MEDVKKEVLSCERIDAILRARLRSLHRVVCILGAVFVVVYALLLLCCAAVEWHPLAIVNTALAGALMVGGVAIYLVCYFRASAFLKKGRYRVVTDTLSHVAPTRRVRFSDTDYKALFNRICFGGGRFVTEVWFNSYGCALMSPYLLQNWYYFEGEPYYLVIADEAPYDIICFFDAKHYELREETPMVY